MAKRKNSVSTFKLALFLVATIMSISFGFYGFQITFSPNILVDKDSRPIIIHNDATFKDIQDLLYRGGYVNDLVSFSFLSKIMKYDKNIKPGRYILERDMTNIAAIRLLRAGERAPVNITFNNVRLIEDLGARITKNLMISEDEFNAALTDYLATNNKGFTAETIISMFIPNTYQVYFSTSAKDLILRMEKEYEKVWNEERLKKANDLGLTPIEISTLASIVQAESSKSDEKPIIAGLYLNRIKNGIALQADPTLVFASGDFGLKRVLNEHKEIESPYNTYKYKGLPPGPINMPSLSSVDAVLDHKEHNYLYMCAKEDFSGYHNFAETYDQHMVNARKYQRQLTIEQNIARQKANN
ncbi:MAG: endolytic transglycosylase MltG [Cyclobacteriaceae bacterium]|nr:endolytic transglycosylase MltG [Cyclobacteriaceae bacterium]